MFEDSLFASNARPAPRRGVATVLSFGIQAVMLTVLVMLPLYYTDALPTGKLKEWVEVPLPPMGRAPQPPQQQVRARPRTATTSNFDQNRLVAPSAVPPTVTQLDERNVDVGPPSPYEVPYGIPQGGNNRMNQIIASNMRPVEPPQPVHHETKRVIISHLDEGLLVHRVTPYYPAPARAIRQQGVVTLQATIGRDGTIQNLRVLNGPPLLIGSAMDAVRQWRYRPYLLNNEPVEVETQITVRFTLN